MENFLSDNAQMFSGFLAKPVHYGKNEAAPLPDNNTSIVADPFRSREYIFSSYDQIFSLVFYDCMKSGPACTNECSEYLPRYNARLFA